MSLGKFNVDAKDATGRTCLHWASENGHVGEASAEYAAVLQ